MSQALCFNDVTLTPVTYQNSIWIKASELSRALGYKRPDILTKLYSSNADEFTPDMTQVIEIVDNTELVFPVKTRIFSLRGCHLLSMFARTPIAKAFRRWVLDVLDTMTAPALPALPDTTTPSTPADRKPLDKLVKVWAQQGGIAHAQAWAQVNGHFNLDSVTQLPVEWIPDAIAFVEAKIDALSAIAAKPEQAALPEAVPVALKSVGRGRERAQSQTERRLLDMLTEANSLDNLTITMNNYFDRLREVTGPLNVQAIHAMRRTDDNVCMDNLISTLGYHRWYARERMHDATNAAREACRSAIVVARLLGE